MAVLLTAAPSQPGAAGSVSGRVHIRDGAGQPAQDRGEARESTGARAVPSAAVTGVPAPDALAGDGASPQGFKGWVSKKVVKLLAHAIRNGGKALRKLLEHLDDRAARVFGKYSNRIADQLDVIAEIPDLTIRMVKEKLMYFMIQTLEINPGTARVICEGVAAGLEVLL